jgi:hypothetical protein
MNDAAGVSANRREAIDRSRRIAIDSYISPVPRDNPPTAGGHIFFGLRLWREPIHGESANDIEIFRNHGGRRGEQRQPSGRQNLVEWMALATN